MRSSYWRLLAARAGQQKIAEQAYCAAAGEYTPRDVVQLLVQLVFPDVEHAIKKAKGTLVAIYDPAAGTGGMLTVAKEYLTSEWKLDPENVFI